MPTTRLTSTALQLLAGVLTTGFLVSACSDAPPAAAPNASRSTTAAPAAYPQPTIRVTPEQARIVTTLGQRNADGQIEDPVEAGMGPLALCRGEDPVVASEGRAWTYESMVLDAPEEFRPQKVDVARAFNGAVVLDDSPAAVRVMDERLARWSSCAVDSNDRLTREKPSVTGAARTVGVARDNPQRPKESRHWYFSAARAQNLLLLCETSASTAESARETSLSCLREMAAAVPVVAHPLTAPRGAEAVAARALLAGVQRTGWEPVITSGTAGSPCPSSDKPFLLHGAAARVQEANDDEQAPASHIGVVAAQVLPDSAKARAEVARARALLSHCARSWVDHPATYAVKGRVDAVVQNRFGDGGVSVTWRQTFPGSSRPNHAASAVFSVDRVVVFIQVRDAASAKQAATRQADLASAVAARVGAAR